MLSYEIALKEMLIASGKSLFDAGAYIIIILQFGKVAEKVVRAIDMSLKKEERRTAKLRQVQVHHYIKQ